MEAYSGTFRSSLQRPSISNANEKYQGRAITDEEEKQLCDLLVDEGISIEKVDDFLKTKKINFSFNENKGWKSIVYAALTGNKSKVKLLLKYGADIDADFPWGSPLLYAISVERNRKMMKCLVECGADVNFRTIVGDNPLRVIMLSWKQPFNEEDIAFLL